jgi:hypothetical protein
MKTEVSVTGVGHLEVIIVRNLDAFNCMLFNMQAMHSTASVVLKHSVRRLLLHRY